MMKIGDEVEFDEYIPKNLISGKMLNKTLHPGKLTGEAHRLRLRRETCGYVDENKIIYRTITLDAEVPLKGIYVGSYRKKLVRTYRKTADSGGIRVAYDRTRYSTNPRRLDDPRDLDKIAIVSYRGILIPVPMRVIFRTMYKDLIRVI